VRADEISFAPPATDALIGSYVGEFRVEKKLGEGGMATVYAAVHPLIGKKAAIKVMAPQLCADAHAVMRFVQEARAVNQIRHDNIVDVFSFGRLPDGRSYFVMEWLPGESLFERLAARRMSIDECLDIVVQICDALEVAHGNGIVHRDIKPANIFLVPGAGRPDQVKLLDFGVAKLEAGELKLSHTRTGFVVGTPDYISPEQARSREVDGATDVYALGVVLFEMILGRLPFFADNPMDMVRMHMTEPPPAPSELWPDVPAALDHLIVSMLKKSPDERPSLDQIRSALKQLRESPRPTLPPRVRRRRLDARRVQLGLGAAALVAGLVVLGVTALHGAPQPAGQVTAAAPKVVASPPAVVAPSPAPRPRKPRRKTLPRKDADYLIDPFDPAER
jgi:serine/threonine-protein kinase